MIRAKKYAGSECDHRAGKMAVPWMDELDN